MFLGRRRLGMVLSCVVAAVVSCGLVAASPASAGTYVVAQCSPGVNSAATDAGFTASTTHFPPFADCSPSGSGLAVNYTLSTGETGTQQGAFGAWVIQAPVGTYITGGSTFSRLATQNGIHGYLAVSPDSGPGIAYETQNDDQGHTAGIPPGNWRFWVARLECTQPNEGGRCVGPGAPHTWAKQLRLQLTDVSAPTESISGSMLSGEVLRGPQTVAVSAGDQGAGLQSVQVLVNGKGAAGDDLSAQCNPLPGGLTSRVAPCPGSFSKAYTLDTASGPFVEGANTIAVCVYDYAQTGTPNGVCESKQVVVDNLCPGSGVAGGQTLTSGFGNGKNIRTLAFRKRALIRGRLRDGGGNPVVGAQVCIEGHTALPERPFHLIGTATTNENGGWTYKLQHGPSREFRIAYRSGAFQTTSDLTLHMHARSTFHISKHRTCIHRKIFFSGGLAGPGSAERVVLVRGTIPGAKRRFLVRRAVTDALGHWRVGYAFSQVAQLTRFIFWAVVPKQAGFAFVKGHSVGRYIRVRPHRCRSSKK
jgi:hypothetical protein